MKKRRSSQENESLDLLLDTITNTFGGLIFIAILIALLVGKKQPDAKQTRISNDTGELALLNASIAEVVSEIDLLKQQSGGLADFSDSFSSPTQQALVVNLVSLNQEVATYENQNEHLRSENENKNGIEAGIRFRLKNIQEDLQRKKQATAEAETKLAEEKFKRSSTIDAPRQKLTTKSPVNIVSRWGRIYLLDDLDGILPQNSTDFEATSLSQAEIVLGPSKIFRTVKTGGISMKDTASLKRFFTKYNSDRSFVNLCIFEESFSDFKTLRDVLVGRNLEHALILFKDGKKISYGAGTSKVQ